MIEAASLAKRYGTFEAVKGVSFRIEAGQIVGLLGPNSAGKTSLMRILTCYHFPDGGWARVDGHDVASEPHRVRRSVGSLPESSTLYPDMKVCEYLGFIARARDLAQAILHDPPVLVLDEPTSGLDPNQIIEIRGLGERKTVLLSTHILQEVEAV